MAVLATENMQFAGSLSLNKSSRLPYLFDEKSSRRNDADSSQFFQVVPERYARSFLKRDCK